MQTLSASLTAHQKASSRRPYLRVLATNKRAQVETPRWTRYYTGSEPDANCAAVIANDGSLIRARLDGADLRVSRVTTPGAGSTYSSWTLLEAGITGTCPMALIAKSDEVTLAYGNGVDARVRHSTDNGATWGAATTRGTGAANLTGLAAAYNAAGDIALFWCWADTSVEWARRTAGAWDAPAGTNWTKTGSVATVTALAATHDGADFALILAGTVVTTLHQRVWAASFGDGGLPLNAWGGLVDVAEADQASTTTFDLNAGLFWLGLNAFAAFVHKEAGNVAYNRAFTTHPPYNNGVLSRWREPMPHEATSAFGLALAVRASTGDFWAVTPPGVWFANTAQSDDLTDRVISCRYSISAFASRLELELNNNDSALKALPNATYDALAVGASLAISPGYKSGPAEAPEYGATVDFTVDQVAYRRRPGQLTVILKGSGPWEAAARWHAPQAWLTAASALTREALFRRIAGKAGYPVVNQGAPRAPSADYQGTSPGFALAPAETGASALLRVLGVLSDQVRPDRQEFRIIACTASDASDFAYGAPGEHPIFELTIHDAPPAANWLRLQGDARYADAFDYSSIYAHGPELALLRNLHATTNALASGYATAALRRRSQDEPMGSAVVPANAGQQVLDVVTITDAGVAAVTVARVWALALDYHRGPGRAARYNSILTLGAR